MIGEYALRHTDTAGVVHTWTCVPESAHYVARWHARDSGQPTEVLRHDGTTWQTITVWTAAVQQPDAFLWDWPDDPDTDDDEPPVHDHAGL